MDSEKQHTAFFSYSRVNKEFATKLAKGLRSAGYPIWFDLFDIPTGSRWDDEVEKALRECSIFMIILTPASIASENVKDEIGYAIDHGKRILPILLEQCDVPLRLRRFQYVDFTAKSFEEGFESAKEILKSLLDEATEPLVAETPLVDAPKKSGSQPAKVNPAPVSTAPTQQKSMGPLILIGSFVVFILVVAGIIFLKGRSSDQPVTVSPVTTIFTITQATHAPTVTEPPTAVVLGIGSTIISSKDGMTLVYIPAGEFTMGSDKGNLDELPMHKVNLDAFWIDRTEVTNKMYLKCVSEGGCSDKESSTKKSATRPDYYGNPKFDNYPVIYMDWSMAKAYCEWANRRLPTEAEWEKAARGENGFIFPWGNEVPTNNLLNYNNAVQDTTEVGKYPNGASPYGVLDMAGNISEWVNDFYGSTYYKNSPQINPVGPSTGDKGVLRGGSWTGTNNYVRSSARYGLGQASATSTIGFRCAQSK